jgi:hypothetical protein
MKEISEKDWKNLTSDELKACKDCKYRIKDNGHISRQRAEQRGSVYGCCLDQSGLYKEVAYLPEHCKARNLVIEKSKEESQNSDTRNNCLICNIYQDGRPACKTPGIKLIHCPCKTCKAFMAIEGKCINYDASCKEKLKYEVLDPKTQV